ncbi:MAG: hypothetical protein ABJL67_23890 [Sulfitobacter sp.]
MATVITGAKGMMAYLDSAQASRYPSNAISANGDTHWAQMCGFARLSAFADNSNHPPADFGGAISWDAGIDLLFRIAGAR